MTIQVQFGWRQLVVGLAVLLGAVALTVWWSSPARSQGAGPAAADTFAFVARADNPVDALAASSAAGQLGAPVYLTFPDSLDPEAAEGLKATAPQVVVLAGGPVALSETVEQQIRELLPDATVRRFAGEGRTETAKLVNELTGELGVDRPVLAGATVTGDVGIDGALTVEGTDVGAKLAALEARVAELEALLAGVTRNGDLLTFSGMNVAIVNGQGTTHSTNGLGNLIVGYNEDHTDPGCHPSSSDCQYFKDNAADSRTGSHNLIIGVDHTYTSYAGLVTGRNNTISGIFAQVSGGRSNTASGDYSTVSGGASSTASGEGASVSGGVTNTASGTYSSVSSGWVNIASAFAASVSGGQANTASGEYSSVSGGLSNTASSDWASVSGGSGNTAADIATTVAGGRDGSVVDAYDSRIGNSGFTDS